MTNGNRSIYLPALLAGCVGDARDHAAAQTLPPTMRKINVGVSVAPPNVVHTSPYVAKELGFFAKRCIDANIIQFEGGQSATSAAAAAQGSAIVSVSDVAIGRGMKVQQFWGLAPAHAAGLHGGARHQDRGRSQGQAGSAPPAAASAASTGAWAARCSRPPASRSMTRSSFRRPPPAGCPA